MLYVDTHKNTIHRYYDDDHIPMNLKPISRPSCSKTELFSKSSNRIENIPEAIIMGVCVYICSSGGGMVVQNITIPFTRLFRVVSYSSSHYTII